MLWRRCLIIFVCLVGGTALLWIATTDAEDEQVLGWREELRQIDAEIKRAQDLKGRYLTEARRAEDQGMQWQRTQKQEAKRAYQRAEDKRQAAEMMQAHIDELKARRAQILQEHPEAYEPIRKS